MRRRKNRRKIIILSGIILTLAIAAGVAGFFLVNKKEKVKEKQPEELIVEYMGHIVKQEYEAMYAMINKESITDLNQKEFITRNQKIYEGMETRNLQLSNIKNMDPGADKVTVSYTTSFDTIAGNVSFKNKATFVHTETGYELRWKDSLILPHLTETDKIRVTTTKSERGQILDRNGKVLAGKGKASSVGIVPGKLEDREGSLKKLSQLLGIDVKTIKSKLEAKWVKEDSFVPITTIMKVNELDLLKVNPDDKLLKEQKRQEKLLAIKGIMISDVEVRSYSLGEIAAHLIGYVQNVTAEDLEAHPGEGYDENSVIGRSGMEALYEKELKGTDGHDILMLDEDGNEKEVVATIAEKNGQDIKLTIDSELQTSLYQQFKEDRGCSVAMNPYTGEVLALVSTPSYDNNDFILGISKTQWTSLNEDKDKPLYNRFRQVWCPGSTFKPIIAAIGLEDGAIKPNKDYGKSGKSWQKDSSWGSYHVTTVHTYESATLKNAIMYSDNIYFAKAALRIGADKLAQELITLGFTKNLPFEITMSASKYSNKESITSEIQLADSGYGQGQVLVNPLHLASIYTAFLNKGDIIKPYLKVKKDATGEVWIPNAFSNETVKQVLEGVKAAVNDPNGTGYAAHREDIVLAGKTGTAELKATKEDKDGTEIGWFSVFTMEKDVKKPVLIVSMVENVKDIGGSSYVVKKDKEVLDAYLK